MRRNITTQGGVGGGCNSKHYWLELLIDRSNNFNWFFDWVFVCQNFSAGTRLHFCHAKATSFPRKSAEYVRLRNHNSLLS